MSGYRIGPDDLNRDYARPLASLGKLSTSGGEIVFSAELASAIRNLVCPECGGPMGGRSKEFKCRGRCGKDWRPEWEQLHG